MSNILDKIKLSGVTYDLIDSTAVHSLDGYYTSGQTNDAITAATSALAQTIAEQGYQTSGDVQSAITEAVSGKADSSDVEALSGTVTGHTANTTIHVTAEDKTNWNSVSGYADSVAYDSGTTTMNFYHGGTGGTVVFSFDASPFIVDGMIDDVRIETLSGETYLVIDFNTASGKEDIYIPLTDIFNPSNYYTKDEIDAALSGKVTTIGLHEYINDNGDVVQEVKYSGTSGELGTAFTFGTEFELNNYNEITISGKADVSAVTAVNNVLTGHTADTSIHVTSTDKTTWSGKQDALVSGTNIKTINGNSLLGSGDITVQTLPTVSGTTLIFS